MTTSVNGSQAASAGFSQADTEVKKSLGQQDFLRLMVAQVQNQDPMQPQANGEFLSQLAQFSTNDGISKMQNSLQQLASSLQSNQALQASALVGRTVLINSDKLMLDEQNNAKIAIDTPSGVTNMVAYIYADTGELVKTMPLNQREPGFMEFQWDGKDSDNQRRMPGRYSVKVNGTYAGSQVAIQTMTHGNVDSVSLGQYGEGLKLNVAGIGSVTLDKVHQIAV